jgi:uncharacterized protein (TIGR02246 family)
MKRTVYGFFVFVSTLICACNNSSKVDPNIETNLLRQTTDSLLTALSDKDAERFADFYVSDALFISPSSGLHHGRDDIRKTYGAGFALPGFYINGSIQEVQVAKSGDIGYTLVPWDSYFIPETGKKIEQKGLNLLVWRKQVNGTWRVIIDKP